MAETLLKCTTRHVRLFTARIDNDDLVISDDELTMDLDPDNEFLWSDAAIAKVQSRFKELVDAASGGELSDYSLRRIGTDLEGFIRQLLQAGPCATDGESFSIQQAPDMPDQLDFVPLVIPPVASTLDRLQLREFLLPVSQHVRFYFTELAHFANGEVALGWYGW